MLLVTVPSIAAMRKKKKKTPVNRGASAPPNTKRPPVGRGNAMEPASPTKEPPVAGSGRPMSDQMPRAGATSAAAAGLRFGDANNSCTGKGICSMSGFAPTTEPNVYVVTIEPGNPPYVPTTSMAIKLDDAQLQRISATNRELFNMLTTQATYQATNPNSMCRITDTTLLQSIWPTVQGLRAANIMFNQPFPITQNRDTSNMIISVTMKLPNIRMIVN